MRTHPEQNHTSITRWTRWDAHSHSLSIYSQYLPSNTSLTCEQKQIYQEKAPQRPRERPWPRTHTGATLTVLKYSIKSKCRSDNNGCWHVSCWGKVCTDCPVSVPLHQAAPRESCWVCICNATAHRDALYQPLCLTTRWAHSTGVTRTNMKNMSACAGCQTQNHDTHAKFSEHVLICLINSQLPLPLATPSLMLRR